jgi:hypothetical protein
MGLFDELVMQFQGVDNVGDLILDMGSLQGCLVVHELGELVEEVAPSRLVEADELRKMKRRFDVVHLRNDVLATTWSVIRKDGRSCPARHEALVDDVAWVRGVWVGRARGGGFEE